MKARGKARPDLDVIAGAHLLFQLGVEEVSANLLVLDLSEQRVKEDLVEVQPVQIHFRDALHPGDLNFILNAV